MKFCGRQHSALVQKLELSNGCDSV